jgi:hypothetical protein
MNGGSDVRGKRIERVVLFGSRARGDARDNFGQEAGRIAEIGGTVLDLDHRLCRSDRHL